MNHRPNLALVGAAAALALAPAALAKTTVSVRVEGSTKTLQAAKTVTVPSSGSITKGGTPAGTCPARSAAGAFDRAVHGRWTAKFYPGVNGGIFITSIFSVKPKSVNDYWTVFADNRSSNVGICSIKPHRGEKFLFAITDGSEFPLVIKAPAQARLGGSFTANVSYYKTNQNTGKTTHVNAGGIHLTGRGVDVVTNSRGNAKVAVTRTGKLTLKADGKGYVRAEPVVVSELP